MIINVASHDSPQSDGRVAIIDLVDNDISLQWHDVKNVEKTDDISSVKDLVIYSGKGYQVFDVLKKQEFIRYMISCLMIQNF